MIECGVRDETPLAAAAVVRDLRLPTNPHGSQRVLLSRGGATLSPANPPSYGPFINTGQPPESSHLSIPFKMRSELKPPISGFKEIAPFHSITAAVPSPLAQPPLSPYASSKSSHFLLLYGLDPYKVQYESLKIKKAREMVYVTAWDAKAFFPLIYSN